MKNNKILYILTLIITLFSFNTNVYAVTCKYINDIKSGTSMVPHEIKIEYGKSSNGADYYNITTKDPEIGDDYISSGRTEHTNYYLGFIPVYTSYKLIDNIGKFPFFNKYSQEEKCLTSIYVKRELYRDPENSDNSIIETNVYKDSGEGRVEYKRVSKDSATELSCLYKFNGKKVWLFQDNKGSKKVYLNQKDVTVEQAGWKQITETDYEIIFKEDDSSIDEYGNLYTCPKYSYVYDESNPAYDSSKPKSVLFHNTFSINSSNTPREDVPQLEKPIDNAQVIEYEKNIAIQLDDNDGRCFYKSTDPISADKKHHEIVVTFGLDDNGKKFVYWSEKDPQKNVCPSTGSPSVCYNEKIDKEYKGTGTDKTVNLYFDFLLEKNSTTEEFFNQFYHNVMEDENYNSDNAGCPYLFVKRSTAGSCNTEITDKICLRDNASGDRVYESTNEPGQKKIVSSLELSAERAGYKNTEYKPYLAYNAEGNTIDGTPIRKPGIPNFEFKFDFVNVENCKDLVGEDGAKLFNIAWNIVKFGVPIALLALGTIDFAQAVFAGKEDGMKKAQDKFIKRLVIAVVIFLVPTLISFLLGIANSIWENIGTDLCGIIF